jgi:hypothetical protein
MSEEIIERLKKLAEEGRITCAAAQGLAEELDVSNADVGRAAKEAGIKIKDCQLGCF